MSFAEVVFNISLDHAFTYHIPADLESVTAIGKRVTAPFGNRVLTGVLIRITEKPGFSNCKDIYDVLDEHPLINNKMLKFTQWIAQYYYSSTGQAIQLALPKGIDLESVTLAYIDESIDPEEAQLTERQNELFTIIGREPGKSLKYYHKKFGEGAFYYLLKTLELKKLVRTEQEMKKPKVKKLIRKFISVPQNLENQLQSAGLSTDKFETLKKFAGKELLFTEFLQQSGISSYMTDKLIDMGILHQESKELSRMAKFDYIEDVRNIKLNADQAKVLKNIDQDINNKKFTVHLLHGVTGSGKTQVYLEAIKKVYSGGKSAIYLIPEISLTPQTVARFKSFFQEKITVVHSRMSQGERFDAWWKIYHEKKSIVIGPRSALFMPVSNPGIIIVDEEHDHSYKQSDGAPRYHARDAAIYYAQLNNAVIVLGSATPSMESYINARNNKYRLNLLENRIAGLKLPKVTVVDMRGIHRKKNQSALFSSVLLEKISDRLEKDQQIILLQNRRGHSSFMQCTDCGFIARCPNCEITLTFHKYNNQLKCHYCSYAREAETECPKCLGTHVRYSGSGTQKIEYELSELFPQAKILRMDQDTTRGKNAYDLILNSFKARHADILLGTQMISKGLDFENVTLVGVISGDIGLSLPDYRAAERGFQLLTQVAGRAGRGAKAGEVIIQTYQHSHYAIQHAAKHDFTGFFDEEIRNRKELFYPPFTRIINLKISGTNLSDTISVARKISNILNINRKNIYEVVGPAPAPVSKINNQFRWHTIIKVNKTQDPAGMLTAKIISSKLHDYYQNKAKDFKLQIDVDPVDMM